MGYHDSCHGGAAQNSREHHSGGAHADAHVRDLEHTLVGSYNRSYSDYDSRRKCSCCTPPLQLRDVEQELHHELERDDADDGRGDGGRDDLYMIYT